VSALPSNVSDTVRRMNPTVFGGGLAIVPAETGETKAAMKLEKELQRLCEGILRQRGIEFLHLSPFAREHKGYADLTFPRPGDGRFVAVELKSANGRLSEDQKRCLARLTKCGALCFVIRSFTDFLKMLDDWTTGAVTAA